MMNGYKDERMNLNDVCEWLTKQGYEELGDVIKDKFTHHPWTVDGMMRKDVIEEVFERVYGTVDMFRALECDVTTALSFVPYHEAHVD
jgi:hypothetical protein